MLLDLRKSAFDEINIDFIVVSKPSISVEERMVGTAGFEPATDGSTVHCSTRLSYVPCVSFATLIAIKGLLSSH